MLKSASEIADQVLAKLATTEGRKLHFLDPNDYAEAQANPELYGGSSQDYVGDPIWADSYAKQYTPEQRQTLARQRATMEANPNMRIDFRSVRGGGGGQ